MGKKYTLAEEYQQLAYGLFQEKLFRLEGESMTTKDGIIEEYISKSELIENAIEVLNEFGKLMASDRRLTHEIDSGESSSVSPKAKAD